MADKRKCLAKRKASRTPHKLRDKESRASFYTVICLRSDADIKL